MVGLISNNYVPDEGPENSPIIFVGEAPGETEDALGRPFVGESGTLLTNTLGRMGLQRNEVRLANLCHYRPQGNKFDLLRGSEQLETGKSQLINYIATHKPNVIVPLGAQALEFFTSKKGIFAWRGSILECSTPSIQGIKTIPTFHPAAVLRDRTLLPIFDGDIRRAIEDSKFAALNLPVRQYVIDPRGLELEEYTELLCSSETISVDIESVKKSTHILCVGFAPSADLGVCIVNRSDAQTQNSISKILSSNAKKVFHFGTFDTEMLHLNGHEVKNYTWDTLNAQHVLNAEMPRGLDFLASIYTREPYYKSSGRAEIPGDNKSWSLKVNKDKLWIYNCKDVCVTMEIALQQMQELTSPEDIRIFGHEMNMIEVGQSMSRNGMPLDVERRKQFETALYYRWAELQNIMELLCKKDVNVRSPKLKELLYGDFKLPVKRKRTGEITTDEDAIVALITYCNDYVQQLKREASKAEWNKKLLILKCILEVRGLRQLISNYIKAPISSDNRIRSTYKFSSTETGRAACEHYVDGTGVNAQTFPRGIVNVPDVMNEIDTSKLVIETEDNEEQELEDIE